MNILEFTIRYFPYTIIVVLTIFGYPEKLISAKFDHGENHSILVASNRFNTLCEFLTLPLFSLLFSLSSIFSSFKGHGRLPTDNILLTLIALIFLFVVITILILITVLTVDLRDKPKIRLHLINVQMNFSTFSKILKIGGILTPPAVDFIFQII